MRNPVYEQALNNQGVEWEYREVVALADINVSKGLRNQARLEQPLDEELVNAYAAADKRGDKFPPLVLWRPSTRGQWIPIDGNQRLSAYHQNSKVETDAYIVKTSDPMIADRLSWTFNNLVNGKRISQGEALRHAITFVRKYGMTQANAAKEWGVTEVQVRNAIKVESVREKLVENEVKGASSLANDKVLRLAPLEAAGQDILAMGATAAVENGLTSEQIIELCKRVAAAKTQQAKVEAVVAYTRTDEVLAQKAETKGGRVISPKKLPRQVLAELLEKVWRLTEDNPTPALRPGTKEQFKDLREKWIDITAKLTAVFGTGSVSPKEDVG